MSTSSFDSFFDAPASDDVVNFMTPTFENFSKDTNYVLEIADAEVEDGKYGKQIILKTDAILADGSKSSQPKIWVSLIEKTDEDVKALALPAEHPDHKKAVQMLGMRGRSLAQFLRAVSPEQFNLVRIDESGKKKIAVSVKTGEELNKEDREALDMRVSQAVAAFSKAAASAGADINGLLQGKRFVYRVEPRKKDPSKTNQIFLLESDLA